MKLLALRATQKDEQTNEYKEKNENAALCEPRAIERRGCMRGVCLLCLAPSSAAKALTLNACQ